MEIIAFVVITALFFVLLGAKHMIHMVHREFCVLCASISMTWVILLVLYWLGYWKDPVLLGILMGESVVGVYYVIEHMTEERFHIFRLPFLLTLTAFVYAMLYKSAPISYLLILLAILWVIFGIFYANRNNGRLSRISSYIIECCKWR